jgi:hypothetical protein
MQLVTPSLFSPNILLSTLFSKTLSLFSSHNVRDYVSHPYKPIGKMIVFYILAFIFFDSDKKTEGSGRNASKHYERKFIYV